MGLLVTSSSGTDKDTIILPPFSDICVPGYFSLQVFNQKSLSMHAIHTDNLAPVFTPQAKLPRQISKMDLYIRYNFPNYKFRIGFLNRMFCKTTFENLFLKDEGIHLEMCNATLFPQLHFQWLSP